ncbi:MAG: lamin tail domain-containing protein [Nonlabens sp.]
MKKIYNLAFLLSAFLCAGLVSGQTTTIDFETESDGYTSTTTEGSTSTDVFNRIDASAESGGNLGGNSSFIWAVEDTGQTPGSITLDQIDVTGSTSFTFSIDMLAHHYQDWDSTDELNITYSLDGGSAQNLMSVQMHEGSGDASNGPAALDTDFDGEGECGAGLVLPALTTGTQHGCTVSNSDFATFVTNPIALSGNTTLDIVLSFENLTATDEGIYIDNIVISQSAGALPPSVGFDNTSSTQNETNSSFAVDIPVTLSDYDGNQVDLAVAIDGSSTAEAGDYTLNTSTLSFTANGTQNVNVTINDDADFNSEDLVITISETTSTGAIVNPDTHTLTIVDDETAPLVINEILADPDASTGDANGDGTASTTQDEFVEIFNNSGTDIDLSGYTLSDNTGVRHTFPSGTVLLSQQAIVVFGGGNIEDFTGVPGLVQVAGSLGLNNGGDTITIADGGGTTLVTETYGSNAGSDQSIAREPDFTGTFVQHSTITTNPLDFSPGSNNVDGTSLTPPNTWTGATDSDWATGSNWTNGIAPREIDDIIIPNGLGTYPIISSTTGAIGNDMTVEGAASLTIQNGGSLILDGVSTGNVAYTVAITDTNWHFIGSPVIDQDYNPTWVANNSIASGSGSNIGISTYDNSIDADGDWNYAQSGTTGTFVNTDGYSLLRSVAGDYSFTGSLENSIANKSLLVGQPDPLTTNKWNLVGNPYPAYISIDDFLTLTANASSLDDTREAVYVWNGSNYQPLTTGFIHPGQGFFLNANTNGDAVSFEKNMRSHQTGITFYSTPQQVASIEVMISNGQNLKNTVINFEAGKTSGLDPRFDLGTFSGVPSSFSIYSKLADGSYHDTNFMIQSLPESDFSNVIPLGITAVSGSNLSISVDAQQIPLDQNIYLEDRLNDTFTLLNATRTFDFVANTDLSGTGRFFLHTTTQTLSNEMVDNNLDVKIFQSNIDTLSIHGLNGADAQVSVYDLLGKQILTETIESSSTTVSVNIANLKTGVYIAQLSTGNASTSQKIIINK